MKKLATLLLCSLALSSCIPAAVIIGATAGGAVVYSKRNIKTITADNRISEGVLREIGQNPAMQGTHVVASTFNHIVLLVGQTPSEEQKQKANDIAENYPGARRVYNEITIAQPTSTGTRANDGWITTKVKTALLGQPGLSSTQVKVITENGVVYLLGFISRKQAELAAKTTSQVDGVEKVVKVFEYVN